MSRDNTARQLYLLVNPNEPTRITTNVTQRRPSGLGLLSAVAVSLLLWAALLWLGSLVLNAISG